MSERFLALFSGFPSRHFPREIAERLQEELTARESLVFISAWPDEHERNDLDRDGMHAMFTERGMPFRCAYVIDSRTSPSAAQSLVSDASCVFLMGGNATEQFQLICNKCLLSTLRSGSMPVLGVSAGSSNMAVRALDIWESPKPYSGLGLTDITVKAHVRPQDAELLAVLQKISSENELPICAMEDDSAIFIKGKSIRSVGTIRLIRAGSISLLEHGRFRNSLQ